MPRGTYARNGNPNEFVNEPRGFVLHPDDVTGVRLHPDERRYAGCCGIIALGGPNLVCDACGNEVATMQADCYTQNQVILELRTTIRSFNDD